jgi:hypothetical protein
MNMFILNHQCTEVLTCVGIFGEINKFILNHQCTEVLTCVGIFGEMNMFILNHQCTEVLTCVGIFGEMNMFILNHQCTEVLACVGIFWKIITIDSCREFLKNRKILVPHCLPLNAKSFTCGIWKWKKIQALLSLHLSLPAVETSGQSQWG